MSEKTTPTPRPGIMDITPYVPGMSKAATGGPVIKLKTLNGDINIRNSSN